MNIGQIARRGWYTSASGVWVCSLTFWRDTMQNEYDSEQKPVLTQVCKRCKKTKPLAQYRYKLTRAQMKAQGYAGNVLVTAEGKVCLDCRPRRKKLTELTNKELITKSLSGDIPTIIAKSRIAKKKKDANALRKRARTERWLEIWADAWRPLLDGLKEDITRAREQQRYCLKRKHYLVDADARYNFFKLYGDKLSKELAYLRLNCRTNPRRPQYTRWEEYIPEAVHIELKDAWQTLPLVMRTGMRTVPTMVKYRYDPDAHLYVNSKPNDEVNARVEWLRKNQNKLPDAPVLIPAPKNYLHKAPPYRREAPAQRLAKYGGHPTKPTHEGDIDPSIGDWSDM